MNDLFSNPPLTDSSQHNLPSFTVSELSGAVKRTVEDAFSYVRVRGEISGFKPAPSGHLYFSLKDDQAVLAAVCWKGVSQQLKCRPEDGLEVICTGKLTTFAGQSRYQLVVEQMELAGIGALMALLEKRKKMLAAEGLFAPERKKPLPFLPRVIGIVTSPTGAVIRDILHRISDRFPLHVLLWPVLVQGDQAAGQITAAIQGFNQFPMHGLPRPDLLIVGRGGGSIEDLWAFNEENVVRAVAASQIPVISAVGHETDTTLVDFVSDRRAPTPTAAAEMAVPVRMELALTLQNWETRRTQSLMRLVKEKELYMQALAEKIPSLPNLLAQATQRLDELSLRLMQALPNVLQAKTQSLAVVTATFPYLAQIATRYEERVRMIKERLHGLSWNNYWQHHHETLQHRIERIETLVQHKLAYHQQGLSHIGALLESYSYSKVLERGFAMVRNNAGLVTRADAVKPGEMLHITWADGEVPVVVEEQNGLSVKEVSSTKKSRKTVKAAAQLSFDLG